jgi:hypothetical protein
VTRFGPKDAGRDIIAVKASDIESEAVRWAWQGWLPLGMISLFVGEPGQGKTTLACELAARLTRGELPGDLYGMPSSVLILSYEDVWKTTLKPRLEVADADVELVRFLRCRDRGRVIDLTRDLPDIEAIVRENKAKLLVIDPLVAGMPAGEVNSHREQDVRSVLAPIAALAEQAEMSMLGLGHLTKSATRAILAAGGSVGFAGAARSMLLFGLDLDDARGTYGPARVLAHVKTNVGARRPSLRVSVGLALTAKLIQTSQAAIGEECDFTADDLVGKDSRRETPKERATKFLRELLADGPHPAQEVLDLAAENGIAQRTLKRVKDEIGVEAYQQERAWFWKLETVAEAANDGDE